MARPTDRTDIHQAIRSGNQTAIKDILRQDSAALYQLDAEGWMPLHTAVATGSWNEHMVLQILKAGAPINAGTRNRNASALMLATWFQRVSLIARLIDWGADLDQAANVNWDRDASLHKAATLVTTGPLHLLLLRGASVNVKNIKGLTPLDIAYQKGRKENIVILEEFGGMSRSQRQGASLRRSNNRSLVLNTQVNDFLDRSGNINLHVGAMWATKQGDESIVDYLLKVDSTLTSVYDDDGWELLHYASWKGYLNLVKLLLKNAANVHCCTHRRGCTPLHLAAQKGHLPVAQVLLRHGATASALTRRGSTPYSLAIRAQKEPVAIWIAEYIQQHPAPREDLERRPASSSPRKDRSHHVSSQRFHEADGNDSADEDNRDSCHGQLSAINSDFKERETFGLLMGAWKDWCQLAERDKPIKIAVLDTGCDLANRDLMRPPVESFYTDKSGNLAARLSEQYPRPQISRIKERLNLAKELQSEDTNIQDLDGHGTRVAGIILRLAPTSELYIARVCDGDKAGLRGTRNPTPENAIRWAMSHEVDVINISLGFSYPDESLRNIMTRAKKQGIIILAAMSNSSNYGNNHDFPANDFGIAIGVHACKPGGTYPSEFTPPPVRGSYNFMVAGESIIAHKLSSPSRPAPGAPPQVSDRFQLAAGTSYATAIATSMVALILAFVRRSACARQRRAARENGIDAVTILKDHQAMAKLLSTVSRPASIPGYCWISPRLLWTEFQPPKDGISLAAREHAWRLIITALQPYKARS